MSSRLSVDVLVVGGGPAGSTLATRLAQLGHRVALVERERFPRPRLGEALTPGVLPLLQLTGAHRPVEQAGFPRVQSVVVDWDGRPRERVDEEARSLLVDRGRFDLLLLENARAHGVTVLQPASVADRRWDGGRWRLRVDGADTADVDAPFLAAAGGRAHVLRGRRILAGRRTICLHAYWQGPRLSRPGVQALPDAWCWGVPLPDAMVDLLIFVDPGHLRRDGRPAESAYLELLGRSMFAAYVSDARRVSPVRGADSTPYRDAEPVTGNTIRVGDAGLALDPISSSGVQKAVQTALSGAVVVNTLLRRPAAAEAARRFYCDSLESASTRHRSWAAAQYAEAGRRSSFWTSRAADVDRAPEAPQPVPDPPPEGPLELSHSLEYVELPCLNGDFVEVKTAVTHPRLAEPVAYLGGWELAPLLRRARPGLTTSDLVRAWSSLVPQEAGLAISEWLGRNGLLVAVGGQA